MTQQLLQILGAFRLAGAPVSCTPYGCGHINETALVVTDRGRRYILQKINHFTFRDVAGLMANIRAVTEHLRRKSADPRAVLTLVPTHGGDGFSALQVQ